MCLLAGAGAVDVGCVALVKTHEILISILGRGESARGGLLDQALDGTDEGLLVRSRIVIPFEADIRVGTVAGVSGFHHVALAVSGFQDVVDEVLDLLNDSMGGAVSVRAVSDLAVHLV